MDPATNVLLSGSVMDIPFSVNVSDALSTNAHNCPYMILFNNGTMVSIPLSEMASLIPPPPVSPSIPSGADALLPTFFSWIHESHLNMRANITRGSLANVMVSTNSCSNLM
jgi:hypothetical protein